ncbi:conserved protein of unknown function [Acidithiobacillus ferrivorans]|uniref:Uncharacterized protein n=1 Tax=Acidithiobacillus ferrivorans TaxID=160808 RepID=A0A060UZM0_9PROT|nr:hypothetical protein [Acidithiobacillus ferrivorans]CDQ12093.1 conserved hypothetical protein [Acidithiobacillus ferrivorans]SMH64780.1 conserved protein of unknown function [Acidithiobacillus ferrivorans]
MLNSSKKKAAFQAVLAQLEIRKSIPKEARSRAVMDDENGKTLLGAMVWNIGTITQDMPEFVGIFIIAVAALFGLGIARLF